MRPIVSSALADCFRPSLTFAICASIAHTISLTRLAWTTACSTACCWLSSALAFRVTCSASAFSDARRSAVLWLSSWSWLSGSSFFSMSFTVESAASVSSRASRDVSRIFV